MYEVLKFIEHGVHCRQSMDCVQGTILLNYLKENPRIEKGMLISWFRELAASVDQYHRSRSRQNYRYLNPCSIVVSEEGRLFLLDMEAPDNEPVMKRMQKRAVRNHFVKPVYEIGTAGNNDADLFAYGRTIQFVLAYSEVYPALSRREEKRLARVIDRCTGETRKKYADLQQVLKDLPPVPKPGTSAHRLIGNGSARVRKSVILAGAAAGLTVCVALGAGEDETSRTAGSQMGMAKESMPEETSVTEETSMPEEANVPEEANILQETDAGYISEMNAQRAAEKAGLAAVTLTESLEKQRFAEEMILVYGRVMELEEDSEKIREAGLKKMELEMQQGNYEQALQTAGIVSEKTGGSERLSALIGECEESIP